MKKSSPLLLCMLAASISLAGCTGSPAPVAPVTVTDTAALAKHVFDAGSADGAGLFMNVEALNSDRKILAFPQQVNSYTITLKNMTLNEEKTYTISNTDSNHNHNINTAPYLNAGADHLDKTNPWKGANAELAFINLKVGEYKVFILVKDAQGNVLNHNGQPHESGKIEVLRHQMTGSQDKPLYCRVRLTDDYANLAGAGITKNIYSYHEFLTHKQEARMTENQSKHSTGPNTNLNSLKEFDDDTHLVINTDGVTSGTTNGSNYVAFTTDFNGADQKFQGAGPDIVKVINAPENPSPDGKTLEVIITRATLAAGAQSQKVRLYFAKNQDNTYRLFAYTGFMNASITAPTQFLPLDPEFVGEETFYSQAFPNSTTAKRYYALGADDEPHAILSFWLDNDNRLIGLMLPTGGGTILHHVQWQKPVL